MMNEEKIITLQVSNDTFWYLKTGDYPLDEDNLDEANEILNCYPESFDICDDYELVENSDLVEITLLIKSEQFSDYDESRPLTRETEIRIKWFGPNKVEHCVIDLDSSATKGKVREKGIYEVKVNSFGHRYYETGDIKGHPPTGMLLYISRFKKRGSI